MTTMHSTNASQPAEELRFGFGKNWAKFVEKEFSEKIIDESRRHLADFMRLPSLEGLTFLDIGCGSGLHSLAALRMGAARVVSFDYDADSVATARKLHEYAGRPENWTIAQGSVLDREFMANLPKSDIVYSWGVLHHTGDMWNAVRNSAIPMKPDGLYYIALYSSDNYVDPPPEYWMDLKRRYNLSGPIGRRIMEAKYAYRFHIRPELSQGRNPLDVIRRYGVRGMSYWTDVRDWLGGWPMAFASLQETQQFCRDEFGLELVNVLTGEGCTEYLFCDPRHNSTWAQIEAKRQRHVLNGPFKHYGGHAYAVELPPDLEKYADSGEDPRRSRMMLYENGRMLGLAHSLHDHIAKYGSGRFSHWGPNLYFSSTDNSDPNENGNTYEYCLTF